MEIAIFHKLGKLPEHKQVIVFVGETQMRISKNMLSVIDSLGFPRMIRVMNTSMNDLEKYFTENKGRLIHKWKHYFEIYDRHFSRFRNTNVNIVEIGVSQGGSLQMWKSYFGEHCQVIGIDCDPQCKSLEEDQINIIIGDQENREFLRSIPEYVPRIDILIDDGGHTMKQQISTFEELFPIIASNGIYLCEDLHTSYWANYGGGYKKSDTFIEYSKQLIDYLNAWHSETKWLEVNCFTRSMLSLNYYDSVLVIEKRPMEPPSDLSSGSSTV